MTVIWYSTSWVLWKERNDRIFRGKAKTISQLLESIKLLSFWWLKAKLALFSFKFHEWCQHPFLCLSAG
jgi:hypothetical protein